MTNQMKSLELNFHFMGVTCLLVFYKMKFGCFHFVVYRTGAVYNTFGGVKRKYFFFCLLSKGFITLFGPICYLFEMLKCVFASVDSEKMV